MYTSSIEKEYTLLKGSTFLKSSITLQSGEKKLIKFPYTSVKARHTFISQSIDSSAAFFNKPALRLLNVIYKYNKLL